MERHPTPALDRRMCSLDVYETPTHFYIIGSDPSGKRFRTLKIDRVSHKEFIANEPDHDYSRADVGELLATVSSSSIVTPTEKWTKRRNCTGGSGLLRTVEKAWGLIGAVRFLEGFYLLLVSRAKIVASIGFHSILKVEDVSMIYIPAMGAPSNPDELKYAKLFQSVDFTADFYFSYTYQLSRTLQENCLIEKELKWNNNTYGRTTGAEKKFVWNEYLLEPFRKNEISKMWTLELMRGYVAHQLVELPCVNIDLVLLARRSAVFAGTRFLKRGTNFDGAVANDVETEQIVWDASNSLAFHSGKFSSFVQRRGSVPLFWSQDSTQRGGPMVGKPPIVIDRVEPNALTTAKHFRELDEKYGNPLIVLNLVKREEHRHNENLLHDIFLKTVRYLNNFRRIGHCIDYISFDVSRCNKTGRVLQRLEKLGQRITMSNGWFQNFPHIQSRQPSTLLRQQASMLSGAKEFIERYTAEISSDGQMVLQHGIPRSNCVDCLDRTNVVQFGIGKVTLGWQLFSMGFISSPWDLHLHTEVCRVFEELFDEHGDILAWQYAGSQLVHSIKTYKRTALFQERSRDVLQTISRYYSNTFGDYEKQDGLNLFLGILRFPSRPGDPYPPIWAFGSDHYLHFPIEHSYRCNSEFLEWTKTVGSNEENGGYLEEDDECMEEGKGELDGWLVMKRSEHNLWMDNRNSEDHTEVAQMEDNIANQNFDLAYRTFEFTSLDQLFRSHQQMQLRRPLVLEALDQGPPQKDSFMRMFKGSDVSPLPGVARRGSASSTLSSLASGTASIVRRDSTKRRRNAPSLGEVDVETNGVVAGRESSEIHGLVEEAEIPIDIEIPEEAFAILTMDEKKGPLRMETSQQQEQEAVLGVAAVEKFGEDEYRDVLVMEDRNGLEEMGRDPLFRFKALLDGPPKWRSTTTISKPQFNISIGLKSPREVYFPRSSDSSALFSISDADMALYRRYASASASIFERHNLRRQRRPTVWKLPAPSIKLKSKSPLADDVSFSSSKKEKEAEKLKKKRSTESATMQRIFPSIGRAAPQSPFRKDFSKLGPMFEFRPALFIVDSVFQTDLGEVPEESMRLYREVVEMENEEWQRRSNCRVPEGQCWHWHRGSAIEDDQDHTSSKSKEINLL